MHQYSNSLYRTRNRGEERDRRALCQAYQRPCGEEVNVVEGDNTKDQHLQYESIFSFLFLFFSFLLFYFGFSSSTLSS